jgi:hypothetical protein
MGNATSDSHLGTLDAKSRRIVLMEKPYNTMQFQSVSDDLAPDFYPTLSSLLQLITPCWAGDAASKAVACLDIADLANSDGVSQQSPECGR